MGKRKPRQAEEDGEYVSVPPSEYIAGIPPLPMEFRFVDRSELEVVDGEWVRLDAADADSPERPERREAASAAIPLTNRGMAKRTTSIAGDDGRRFDVACGLDMLRWYVFAERYVGDENRDGQVVPGAKQAFAELVAAAERPKSEGSNVVRLMGADCWASKGPGFVYGRHINCPVQFQSGGIRVSVVDPATWGNPKLPVAQVIVGSLALTKRGHHRCIVEAEALVRAAGWVSKSLDVNRVDVRADVLNCDGADFRWYVHNANAVITRMDWSKRGTYGGAESPETVFVGTQDRIRLQIYDKLKRLENQVATGYEREADEMWESLKVEYGYAPHDVLRAEFQFSRPWLSAQFVDTKTVPQLVARLDHITDYLYADFFRVLDRPASRGQRASASGALHPVWASVVDGVRANQFGGDGLSSELAQRVRRAVRTRSLDRAEQALRKQLVKNAALSMTREEIVATFSDPAALAAFGARCTVSAGVGHREEMMTEALALQDSWRAKGVLPEVLSGCWSSDVVKGLDVTVHRLYGSEEPVRQVADEVPF